MRTIAFLVLLGLGACAAADTAAPPSADVQGWQLSSGKPPSKDDFAAVVAACQDRARDTHQNGPLDDCLVDLGLRRTP